MNHVGSVLNEEPKEPVVRNVWNVFEPREFPGNLYGPCEEGEGSITELSKTDSDQRQMEEVIKMRDKTVFSQA